ncbi:MAG TPA: OsmC family protein [Actinomycetota bacterium]|nr:OsmC family protein [Actinomycetota bacterium]
MPQSRVDVRGLQAPIRERYLAEPESPPIVITVRSAGGDLGDPLHCAVAPDAASDVVWRSGAHAAVGGSGDVPCSADLLLGALVACQETTLRMVAANAGIELEELEVTAEGDWDPRGTLAMGKEFPVGLTGVRCHTRVVVRGDARGERAERFLRSAERFCVVLNTLRDGVPVRSTFDLQPAPGDPASGI